MFKNMGSCAWWTRQPGLKGAWWVDMTELHMQPRPRSRASLKAELYLRAYWRFYLYAALWVIAVYALL